MSFRLNDADNQIGLILANIKKGIFQKRALTTIHSSLYPTASLVTFLIIIFKVDRFIFHLDKKECLQFFEILNSEEYAQAKATYPVQYLIKVGSGTHQGKGVDLLTEETEATLRGNYSDGDLCGTNKGNLIAQKYISNPLLIYNQQKFDFRVYVLIAATNPLIAFYHDGFARVSLQTYNPNSTEVIAKH